METERPCLLLVDDDAQVREIAGALLQEEGYSVRLFPGAAAAWEALDAGLAAAALLVDVAMPGMSGTDLVRQVQARWPRLPVIFLTGDPESAARGGQGPADSAIFVLQKPYRLQELLGVVSRAIRAGEGG
ncbi:MAG TPA: response regulator [Acetobacteraceae bacterium]|nr:response regulator [Acetobacteraceae bacterium]